MMDKSDKHQILLHSLLFMDENGYDEETIVSRMLYLMDLIDEIGIEEKGESK